MKSKMIILTACMVILCILALPIRSYARDSAEIVPVYRLYNETNREHLYTTNPNERDMCISVGWKDEGIGWYAPARSDWPVRRLYHAPSGSHVYSQNPEEMAMLVDAGWKLEGVAFFSSQTMAVEVRRQYLPALNLHNYSYNPAEIELLKNTGWKIEGTAWFAVDPHHRHSWVRHDAVYQTVHHNAQYQKVHHDYVYEMHCFCGHCHH